MPLPPAARLAAGTAVAGLMILLQARSGASPGQALVSVRLRRAIRPTDPPGRAAVERAWLFALAALPTFGVLPVVMVMSTDDGGWRRTWYDRMAGTVVIAKERDPVPVQLVTANGHLLTVTQPTVLGRAPDPLPGRASRLLPSFQDDPSVSKTHALLEPARSGMRVTDLNSTNGTHAEDSQGIHRLRPGQAQVVERGRRVYFGDTECVIR
ncbi:RDD family protein [Actinomyces sp. 432]|uniref:FHA domain-containing protein n=1 Tax=Actinomyces sp. 432 TaxID=2057798 RepID=UPI001373EC44|nr:FHA domain-containing protein [Actinomyces sp. 432]QHO90422.1 RDD family protein [Actinomyces sp. 432]